MSEKEAREQANEVLDQFEGLLQPEIEMAREHGLIPKSTNDTKDGNDVVEDSENKEEEEVVEKEEIEKEQEVEEEVEVEDKEIKHSTDLDETFEAISDDPQKEHETVAKFSKEQKSFYFKWKKDKRKRQDAEQKQQFLEMKIKELEKRLDSSRPNDLDTILESEEEKVKAEQPLTRKEYEADLKKQREVEAHNRAVIARINEQEAEGKLKYEDFDEVVSIAAKVFEKKPALKQTFITHMQSPELNAAEFAYEIGSLYKSKMEGEDKREFKTKKIIKKQTSASLPNAPSNSVKRKAYDELEPVDVLNMSSSEWGALPKETRDRLLGKR